MNAARIFICLGVLISLGCASKPIDRYYTLHYPMPQTKTVKEHALTLKVRAFDAVDVYRQERIVRRKADNEITYYDTHRWAAPLERMVTDRAIEIFRTSLPVHRVIPWADPGAADFLVDGRILLFEENLQGDHKVATVGIRIWLDEHPIPPTDKPWVDEIQRACTPAGSDPSDTAIALNQCLQDTLSELSEHLAVEIERRENGDR